MLRIKEEDRTDRSMTLRLDGNLVNQWNEVLRASCAQSLRDSSQLILDLAGLSFADFEGVKLLQQLEGQKVALINCSPFLREQMKQATNPISPDGSNRE